jgi:hypothetical protein
MSEVEKLYEGFNLSKDAKADEQVGEPNESHLICPECRCIICVANTAKRVAKDVR